MNQTSISAHSRRRLLVVDDDPALLDSLRLLLDGVKYEIINCASGTEALSYLKIGKPDLILSDFKMPGMSGLDLFNKVKKMGIPFIIMTGYSDVLDLQTASDLGLSEFILKPFSQEDILSCLELVEQQTQDTLDSTNTEINLDSDYCRVSIDEFISGSRSEQDTYIRLNASKFLRIAKRESPLNPVRLRSYKLKGVQHLYIKKEDFAKYVGFNLKVVRATGKKPIGRHQKLALHKSAAEICIQNLYVNGVNREQFNAAREVIDSTLKVMTEANDIFMLLEMLRKSSDVTYAHSLGVGLYGSMIAKASGWTAPSAQFKVAMAGIMHDIGKKELPHDLINKPRFEWTADEAKAYESHTVRGKEILSHSPNVPDEIIQVAIQHHENGKGMGFPFRLPRNRIIPLAALISVADEFCKLVLSGPFGEGIQPHDAIGKLFSLKRDELDLTFLRSLMITFNFPVPIELKNLRSHSEVA